MVANGVSACYVDARVAGLRAHGEPHESTPVSLHTNHLRDCLHEHAVLVVPGFIAQDIQGRTVLLGRGGSDLTALFLAKNLEARLNNQAEAPVKELNAGSLLLSAVWSRIKRLFGRTSR